MTSRPALLAPEPFSDTAHSLALLAEYTHCLDTLPMELSRNFGDLRELDAVLSSSIKSISAKIAKLTDMIQVGSGSPSERLWLLAEIAEDANRLKLGGDDKIRVACQAADNLRNQSSHLRDLARAMPGFDSTVLLKNTVYPHVSSIAYPPPNAQESGRRRKVAASGALLSSVAGEASPQKKRKVPRDDDDLVRISRKERAPKASRKKQERAPSPADSQVSVTSNGRAPHHASSSRAGHNSKRYRNGHANSHHPAPYDPYVNYDPNLTNGSRRGHGTPDMTHLPPAAHHPSIPLPYPNGAPYNGHGIPYDAPPMNGEWDPMAQHLEGPGVPVPRGVDRRSAVVEPPLPIIEDGDGDGDGDGDDGKTYCFCERVSYGQMIACDNNNCEREWFHLECIGLDKPPEGRWYCEVCKKNRPSKGKGGRGGKRKGSGRGGARASASAT